MKQLLAALTAVFLAAPVWAANTATEMEALNIRVGGLSPVRQVLAAIDTADTDLTLYDPPADQMVCIVGLLASEGTAANLTFKSGSTTKLVLELAANQGGWSKITDGADFCTAPGQDLIIQSSAAYSYLLFSLVVGKSLKFGN